MDGGAWWAAVHEVAKNQTRLSDGCDSATRPEGAFREPAALAARVPGAARTGHPLLSLEIEFASLEEESTATFPSQVMAPGLPALRGASSCMTLSACGLRAVCRGFRWQRAQKGARQTYPKPRFCPVGPIHPNPSRSPRYWNRD